MKGLLPLLWLFPAAYVIRLFLLFGLAISNEIGIGHDFGAILGTLATGSITYAESLIPIWLTLAGAFLLAHTRQALGSALCGQEIDGIARHSDARVRALSLLRSHHNRPRRYRLRATGLHTLRARQDLGR